MATFLLFFLFRLKKKTIFVFECVFLYVFLFGVNMKCLCAQGHIKFYFYFFQGRLSFVSMITFFSGIKKELGEANGVSVSSQLFSGR